VEAVPLIVHRIMDRRRVEPAFQEEKCMERANAFDFLGPRTLVGPELKPGDRAPAFKLTTGKATISSEQFAGKPLVISVIPSIDTGVCSKQTRRFNEGSGGARRCGQHPDGQRRSAVCPGALVRR
jgi:hypothetical protein